MQSTDIFTVGGSISVNAHGMDHLAGAIARSIKSMRVMLADGTTEEIDRTRNPELFRLVVGGYGLFAVILDADLDVADNVVYRKDRQVIDYTAFPTFFERSVVANPSVGLMYAHLSTAPSSFLRQTLVYTYTKVEGARADAPPLQEIGGVGIARLTMNLSKQNDFFKEVKWIAEKQIEPWAERCTIQRSEALGSAEACLVTRNEPMHDSVAYLRNSLKNDTDILHEYFIPRDQFVAFVDGMRGILEANRANLLNASVRVVDEEDNFLSYSPQKSFSVVLYLNQTTDDDGNRRMKDLTRQLIDLTLVHGGKFFLPYQLHYSADQLRRAYPQIGDFFAAKRRYDAHAILTNTFYQTYAREIATN